MSCSVHLLRQHHSLNKLAWKMKNTGEYDSIRLPPPEQKKKKPRMRIKRVKGDSYLTYGQSCKTRMYTSSPNINNSYGSWKCNMGWEYILRKQLGRYTNWRHCIAVDLILKHNHKGSRLGRVRYIICSTNMKPTLWRHIKRCHSRLHYHRKFKVFIFLIGYINVNKDVFFVIKL